MKRRDEGSEAPDAVGRRISSIMVGTQRGSKKKLRQGKDTGGNDVDKFQPPGEVQAEKNGSRKALPVFMHDIMQLLDQAMPGLDNKAKDCYTSLWRAFPWQSASN